MELGPQAVDLSKITKMKKVLELFGLEESTAGEITKYLQRLVKDRWREHITTREAAGISLNVGALSFCSYMQGMMDGLKARKADMDVLEKALNEIEQVLRNLTGSGGEKESGREDNHPESAQADSGETTSPQRECVDEFGREGAGCASSGGSPVVLPSEVPATHCCGGGCHGGEDPVLGGSTSTPPTVS